jgi:hypothetical protein
MNGENKYSKVLLYIYGKVGSTSIRYSGDGAGRVDISDEYPEYIIQTHSHEVANDVLKKYKNVLVINTVRFTVDYNISAFWENIRLVPNYKEMSIYEINDIYNNSVYYVKMSDYWMDTFFSVINIDINSFEFDFDEKHTEIKKDDNTFLFFRFEDFQYITDNILPKYDIFVKEKINVGSEKEYASYYKKHKDMHKVPIDEEIKIRNSVYVNKFYSNEEIERYLAKWKSKV